MAAFSNYETPGYEYFIHIVFGLLVPLKSLNINARNALNETLQFILKLAVLHGRATQKCNTDRAALGEAGFLKKYRTKLYHVYGEVKT